MADAAVEAAVRFEVAALIRGKEDVVERAGLHCAVQAESLNAQGVGYVIGGEMQFVGRAFDESDLGWLVREFLAVDLDGLGFV